MPEFTKLAKEIFAPFDAAGNRRSVDNGETQLWGTEVERGMEGAAAGRVDAQSWSDLSAIAGDRPGQPAIVYGPDAGTHTDPVTGQTVSNEGMYAWSDSPAGWRRVSDVQSELVHADNVGQGSANAIQATVVGSFNREPYRSLITLNFTEENTGAATVSINGESPRQLVTNTGDPVPSGYLHVGMSALVQIDENGNYRLFSYGDADAAAQAAEAAQQAAEDARDAAEQAAGSVQFPVSYGVVQSLADADRLRAAQNIGAISTDPQSLDAVKSLQAQANIGPVKFDTVADLVADTILDYAAAPGRVAISEGKQIEAQGHRYKAAAPGATDYHVQMAGGPRLYVGREAGGIYSTSAFGVKGNGIDDDTIPMQRCLNAAGQYGIVIVDRAAKSIRVTDTLVVPNALTIMSYCHSVATPSPRQDAPIIWLDNPAGGKPLFEAGAGGIQLDGVWLMGLDPSTPLGTVAMPTGSTAVKSLGVIRSDNLTIMSFDTAIEATAGYYHQHVAPIIRNCKTIFKNAGAYNFHVERGKFNHFDTCFISTGGTGPISFVQSSFESWTTQLCSHQSSGNQKITMDHCYYENSPGLAVAAGLSTANGPTYARAIGFNGGISLSIRDSNISLKGVRRWVNNTGSFGKMTVSDGNTFWLFAAGAGEQLYDTETLFLLMNAKVFKSNDIFFFTNPDGSYVDHGSWTGTTAYKNSDANLTGAWDWFGFDYVRKIGPLPASAAGLKAGTMYNNAGTVSVAP